MASQVKIEGVSKAYTKDLPVLTSLDLTVEKGEIFFLLGPSGCGKSTLLRIIAGLVKEDSGRILIDGEDIRSLPPEKRRTAMVFQNYALWPHLTVFENVAFGLRVEKIPEKELKKRVEEALSSVKMLDFASRKPGSLSGGQQQRIALARAIAVEPRVLLLDEPLSNLDAVLRDEMRMEIKHVCSERGLTAIYVTHDCREALSLGDRLALLEKGKLKQVGTPMELYRHPASCFAASFLGGVNFFPGRIREIHGKEITLETSLGVWYSHSPLPEGKKVGDACTLLLRPENILVSREKTPGPNSWEAASISHTFFGERSRIVFEAGNHSFQVSLSPLDAVETGKCAFLSIHPDSLAILED